MRGILLTALAIAAAAAPARADLLEKAARETAEYVIKKFGRSVAGDGVEALAAQVARAAAKHGDDVLHAVKAVGPKALTLADEAGELAPRALQLLARHGDDAAWVLAQRQGMALFARFGDEAAEVMIKHKGVAGPILEQLGEPAAGALGAIGPQNGRRLAMMLEDGAFARMERAEELLKLIRRTGDAGMEFIWRHKAVLASGAVLASFLNNPEPYLDGTQALAGTVAEHAIDGTSDIAKTALQHALPTVVAAAGEAVQGTAQAVAWPLVALVATGVVVAALYAFNFGWKPLLAGWRRLRPAADAAAATPDTRNGRTG